jgi:hypothetical protein
VGRPSVRITDGQGQATSHLPGRYQHVPAPHIEYLKGGYTMRRFAHYRGHFTRGRGYRGYGTHRNRRYGR